MTTSSPVQRLAVKIDEAAAMCGVGRTTIKEAIKRGDLHASRKLRHKLILIADLEKFLRA
jgi:excisionase family DNA binding protein